MHAWPRACITKHMRHAGAPLASVSGPQRTGGVRNLQRSWRMPGLDIGESQKIPRPGKSCSRVLLLWVLAIPCGASALRTKHQFTIDDGATYARTRARTVGRVQRAAIEWHFAELIKRYSSIGGMMALSNKRSPKLKC